MVDEQDAHAAQLHDEIVPFLGERAVTLFAFSVADAVPAPDVAAPYAQELAAAGDDPRDPQVTEAERLLLDWARLVGAGRGADDPALHERLSATFQPRLRDLLEAYASAILELCRRAGRA
jgi:hypothetical protein